jgi:transcriptional regulator with XRE-family HTH domain
MNRKSRSFPTDLEVRKRIAANVTNLLEVRGLSRRDLAKKTGDAPATVARVAQGKHTAQAGVVVRVADALGVTVDRLLVPR